MTYDAKRPLQGVAELERYKALAFLASSAFYDFVQMYVHHVQMRVQTRRLAHGPFQLAVH
jgi:hypothetical protein